MRVSCSGLGVTFHSAAGDVQALSNVTFETREGEFLAIVGPSGSGKTTLLRVLAGQIVPEHGAVARIPSPDGGSRALMVSQENSLFPWMTVLENAAFGLEMMGIAKPERHARARELLQRTGIAGWDHYYPAQLSLGMKQRVAVIRSFLSDPSLLLMDEPFSALDVQTRLTLQEELLALWEQSHRSVVFVTHDVEEAILLSDRVLVLGERPGTLVGRFSIPFPRPRHASLTLSEEFLFLKRRIWTELGLQAREEATA
jgi:NitT/TauT family transport system ATP-binding protein